MTHHFLRFLLLFQQIVVHLGVHRTQIGKQYGLTNMLMAVMGTIFHHENCILRNVATENMISLPAASRMVDMLVRKGLVNRSVDATDRRKSHLILTPKGKEVFALVHEELGKILDEILASISEEKQEALAVGLQVFVDSMKARELRIYQQN